MNPHSKKYSINAKHIHWFGIPKQYVNLKEFSLTPLQQKKIAIKMAITSFLLKKNPNRVKIISLFRNPIDRNISTMFHSLYIMLYEFERRDNRSVKKINELLDLFFTTHVNHDVPNDWFEEELEKLTGINIHNYDFDKDKGYTIIKKGNFDVLLLTAEMLNNNHKTIGDFLGVENFEITSTNKSSKKWYGELYNRFRNNIKLDNSYIKNLLWSNNSRYFYTDDQIRKFEMKYNTTGNHQ